MNDSFSRRDFLHVMALGSASLAMTRLLFSADASRDRPNVILVMADDLGWGDTGYNGHSGLKTPNLDEMADSGIRFDRFYSGAPLCSPTRGSCLTGRHPYRYGVFKANVGHLPAEEITLAEALKTQGYATGHFGKWHLGTLTRTVLDSNRGGRKESEEHYSPPWDHGFDICFSTEAKVPTWNPMKKPGGEEPYGTYYWKEDSTRETGNLEGDDSRIIMDRVIPFLRRAVEKGTPFFAVVWFHSPHLPALAGPEHRKLYDGLESRLQDYYGTITAMDEQLGRLRKTLRDLGAAENTMLWFCSDNGPEGGLGTPLPENAPGSSGPFRGRKRDLWEGGIRVPGLLEWPEKIGKPRVVSMPCCTSDYYHTVLGVLGLKMEGQPEPIDGISLLPLIEGRMTERSVPIAFESRGKLALIDNRYKLVRPGENEDWMLFDLLKDPGETRDLEAEKPGIVSAMKEILLDWQASCTDSRSGKGYR